MLQKIILHSFFLFILASQASGQVIEVGLFAYKSMKKVMVIAEKDSYIIYGDGIRISELLQFEGIRVEHQNGKVAIRSLSNDYGSYKNVEFRAETQSSLLTIKGIVAKTSEREYSDHLKINVSGNALQLVNFVNLDNYVGGVVEAETGKNRPYEFYKVQSIISRTYALANFRRHEGEGFQLCDAVHCQVYHGRSRFEKLIQKAVLSTEGIVIVNSDIELITAAFSSNCGGKTRNAEDVWSKDVSYLKARIDTFCLNEAHARWTASIPLKEWKNYVDKNHISSLPTATGRGDTVMDDSYSEFLFKKNELLEMRRHFRFKSTRFVLERKSDSMVFVGRGFGHGVGLCQEGAIHMGGKKYSYKEILDFYYTDIHLIQLSALNFFKSE
jgi:stage II sporulation protein D